VARGATKAARRKQRRPNGQPPRRRAGEGTPNAVLGPAVGKGLPGDVPRPSLEGADVAPFVAPGVNDVPGQPTAVFLPTSALVKMVELGRAENLELQLDPGVEETIDQHGTHLLHNLTRVTAPGVDFVRCFARVLLTGQREYEVFLDLPTRYVGMLVEASKPREAPPPRRKGQEAAPRWAGSWSFERAFTTAGLLAVGASAQHPHPREVFGAAVLEQLREAHVLVIDPEQVAVLPEWEGWENLWDYTADCDLPFEKLYLDLEGPGYVCPRMNVGVGWRRTDGVEPTVPLPKQQAHGTIRGAVVQRLHYPDVDSDAENSVAVDPIGEMWYDGEQQPAPRYEVMGRVVFNTTPPDDIEEGMVGSSPLVVGSAGAERVAARAVCVQAGDITPPHEDTPGYVVVPLTVEEAAADEGSFQARAQAAVVLSCASRVMAALSITGSDAVVIDEADLPARDRRRAEKRGWPIADKVFVRPTRKGGERNVTGEEAHYSHRFWVRGHTKHFPLGTRTADARPDLVKPCTRVGDASCGFCRRVWTPPFVKGPEDTPLVLKSLVKRRDL
jgi:hypothetical protein